MNIHEHQAKQILKKYGASVPKGDFAFTVNELIEKAKKIKTEKYVLKAQIHAGGRGKAGGVKILNNIEELIDSAKEMLGKTLITHQTGLPKCSWPPFFGVTPPTRLVPYLIACSE